jgi:AGCS family alanine or glycine:cation symporter
MIEAAARLRDVTWGLPLILLLAGMGLYLTVLLRGLQFRGLFRGLDLAFVRRDETDAEGDVSHFQALMISLAATIGTTGVVGIAAVLVAGGPGALVWMWIAALLAMATRFAEAVLGVRFRETDERGHKSGGPMYYLENGLRWGRFGRGLALVFAVSTGLAALGIGNGLPSYSVATSLGGVSGLPPILVGAATATLVGIVVLGGVRSIGRFAGVFVPLSLLAYLAIAGWVLWSRADLLPELLRSALRTAFDGRAAGGGLAGYTLAQALRQGASRGLLGGEAGLGTGGIAAAAARTREPVRQALVAMTGPLIDTILVGTVTGMVILALGPGAGPAATASAVQTLPTAGLPAVQRALAAALPGAPGAWAVALTFAGLAFTTIVAWAYFGERCVQYVAGQRAVLPFRLLFIGIIPLGSVLPLHLPWALSDALRAVAALVNLLGLVLLSGIVVREAKRTWRHRAPDSEPAGEPGVATQG